MASYNKSVTATTIQDIRQKFESRLIGCKNY